MPRAKPSPRLRTHDGLGPGRSSRPRRRPRHQLYLPVRCAACHRSPRRASGTPAQPCGRLRRWRDAPRPGNRLCPTRDPEIRKRAGRRRRDDGRLCLSNGHHLRAQGDGHLGRRARHEHARWRSAFLRRLRMQGRQIDFDRVHRASILRPAAGEVRNERS